MSNLVLTSIFVIVILVFSPAILAKTKCLRTSGQLVCPGNAEAAADVQIKLMDYDGLPWEQDDHMGMTYSDAEGYFDISGCGYDFGPWNTPDPYLTMMHYCAQPEGSTFEVGVWPTFLPEEQDMGTLILDAFDDGR